MKSEEKWNEIFNVLKEIKATQRSSCLVKAFFKNEGKCNSKVQKFWKKTQGSECDLGLGMTF